MHVLIVDDEIHAQENLTVLLKQHCPEIEEIVVASSVDQAVEILENFNPDILFLDIGMPQKNGFELLAHIQEVLVSVIFVTAHDEYALKALEFGPTGYILKPIIPEKLVISVQRAIKEKSYLTNSKNEYKEALQDLHENLAFESTPDKMCLRHSNKMELICISEILYLESAGSYTYFYLEGRKVVVSKTLKTYVDALPIDFMRIHRSYLVNLKFVKELDINGKSIILLNGKKLSVSIRKLPKIKARLL